MPLVWQDPEIAFICEGVKIYRTYDHCTEVNRATYWYSFSMIEDEEVFDVRSLPADGLDHSDVKNHETIIQKAIDKGHLQVPENADMCTHEDLEISTYKVIYADTPVTLIRNNNAETVFDLQFNRVDGNIDLSTAIFHCQDCGGEFRWDEVIEF